MSEGTSMDTIALNISTLEPYHSSNSESESDDEDAGYLNTEIYYSTVTQTI